MRTPSRFVSLATFVRAGALSAGLLICVAPTAWAQALNFSQDGGLIFWTIRANRTADFEFVVNKYKEALIKSEDPATRALANGWKVYRAQEPTGDGNVLYLFLIESPVSGADYSATPLVQLLYDTFPDEAQDLGQRVKESVASGLSSLNLQLVTTMSP